MNLKKPFSSLTSLKRSSTEKRGAPFATKSGSATLEYIIVSTFALLLSIAAVTFIGKLAKAKIDLMAERAGVSSDDFDVNLGLD